MRAFGSGLSGIPGSLIDRLDRSLETHRRHLRSLVDPQRWPLYSSRDWL